MKFPTHIIDLANIVRNNVDDEVACLVLRDALLEMAADKIENMLTRNRLTTASFITGKEEVCKDECDICGPIKEFLNR